MALAGRAEIPSRQRGVDAALAENSGRRRVSAGGRWLPLFMRPRPGVVLQGALPAKISTALRKGFVSPRLPNRIAEGYAIPRTLTGKSKQ